MGEQDPRQVNFRLDSKTHRMARRLAESRGQSLPALTRGILENHVKVELGIDPAVSGAELDIALIDIEIETMHDEVAGRIAELEAEKSELQARLG